MMSREQKLRVVEMSLQFGRGYVARGLVENPSDSAFGECIMKRDNEGFRNVRNVLPHLDVCSFLTVNDEPVPFENCNHVFP